MGYAKDYPYIRAWGRMMGSNWSYVEDQMARARVDRAPADAIYKRDTGWVRFSEVTEGSVKDTMERLMKEEKADAATSRS